MQHLALGDYRGGARQNGQHRQRAVLDHQFEGAAEQEIADQHAGLVAEQGVGRSLAPTQFAFIDHVVVQESGGVNELDAGSQLDMALALVPSQAGRSEGQNRPQPLAAGGDDMASQLRNQSDRRMHAIDNGAVDLFQVVLH